MESLNNCNNNNGRNKRRISDQGEDTEPDWSGLPPELIELILSKLSIINIIHCQAVCYAWCSVVKSISSSSSGFSFSRPPWLMVPNDDDDDGSFYFFSAEDERFIKIKKHESVGKHDWCIGSSNGWVVLLDDRRWVPYLLNPFSQVRIQLPPFAWLHGFALEDMKISGNSVFQRVILLSNPSQDKNNNYAVVAIYWNNHRIKLCFCKSGDREWTDIDDGTSDDFESYSDIVCHNDMVYTISTNCSIEAWDFLGSTRPIKRLSIKPALLESRQDFGIGKLMKSHYLVDSSGKLLLVVKSRTYYLAHNQENLQVEEEDLILRNSRMYYFDVYELDLNKERWALVELLGDRVLFLGKSHSMSMSSAAAKSFPGFEGDSIHFTSEYRWFGHCEVSVFSLECRTVIKSHRLKVTAPPLWMDYSQHLQCVINSLCLSTSRFLAYCNTSTFELNIQVENLKESLESKLENELTLKFGEVASAVTGKEEALSSALLGIGVPLSLIDNRPVLPTLRIDR